MILLLFNSQLLRKLFYINTVGLIYTLITCNCIYIYNQLAVYSMNGKANFHIDLNKYLLSIIDS